MANKPSYTANDRAIVDALRNAPEGLTKDQLCEVTGLEIKPQHLVSAMRKGLIASIGETTVERPGTRKVHTYNFVTAEVLLNAEGKPFNYTDGENEILKVAATIEGPFTLADLAEAMGVEKLTSGRINGLVNKKGNITKGDKVEVPTMVPVSVKIYGYVKDIPADAE